MKGIPFLCFPLFFLHFCLTTSLRFHMLWSWLCALPFWPFLCWDQRAPVVLCKTICATGPTISGDKLYSMTKVPLTWKANIHAMSGLHLIHNLCLCSSPSACHFLESFGGNEGVCFLPPLALPSFTTTSSSSSSSKSISEAWVSIISSAPPLPLPCSFPPLL